MKKLIGLGLFSLTSFPVFALIIRGWVSAILFWCLLVSLIYLIKTSNLSFLKIKEMLWSNKYASLFIILPFAIPVITVLLTSLGKLKFNWHDLDGPSRYVFAIVFFLFLLQYKPVIHKKFIVSVTLMPVMTLLLIGFFDHKDWAALSRTTIYFIDPITFGSLCLTFALLGLTLLCQNQIRATSRIWFILSMLSGFYLSISSESRTGWIAVPITLFLLLKIRLGLSYLKTLVLGCIAITLISATLYHSSEIIHSRFNQVAEEVQSYQWDKGNNSTSIGERISYIRIGWYLTLQRPFTGWANFNLTPELESPEFSKFATPATRLGVQGGGFHNEFVNSGVKYGFPGLICSVLLFLGPAIFFFSVLKTHRDNLHALLALVYITTQSISALSYQVLDFKFTASLYALMIVTFAYLALTHMKNSTTNT